MSKLLEHHQLKHKDQDYRQTIIETVNDFDIWYKSISGKDLIYRGQKYARYKNYSSGQRKWILDSNLMDELGDCTKFYTDYISNLILKCRLWENSIIVNFLGKGCEDVYDLMLLSIMQHYGAPTPLIDFTSDLDVALWFACHDNNKGNEDIDNYMSIYSLNVDENKGRILKLSDSPELKFKPYEELANLQQLILIDKDEDILHSNLNIIAQNGVLLMNYHPWKYLGGWSNEYKIAGKITVKIDIPKLPKDIPVLYHMNCADIHKSLIPYIKKQYLNNLGNLFPKYDDMVQYIETTAKIFQ